MRDKDAAAYRKRVNAEMPRSQTAKMTLRAYIIGGLICCLGQGFRDIGELVLRLEENMVSAFASVCLVFLSVLLTACGLYDRIAKFAGAGTVVPITGFANAMASPAMEYRREGLILGVGSNLFKIAGPVLVYGVISSVAVGLLHLLFT